MNILACGLPLLNTFNSNDFKLDVHEHVERNCIDVLQKNIRAYIEMDSYIHFCATGYSSDTFNEITAETRGGNDCASKVACELNCPLNQSGPWARMRLPVGAVT